MSHLHACQILQHLHGNWLTCLKHLHTYLPVDFTDEQVCPVWDVSLAMGPLSGQTLIDSGASRHSLGRLGMKYAQNVRKIDPLIMNTANGQVMLSLVGDGVLKDGTLVRDWLINKWSETNLLSEGLANADKSTKLFRDQ